MSNETSLHAAVRSEYWDYAGAEVGTLLLKAGPDVNTQDEAGDTAYHMAAARGYEIAVRLPMKAGADATIRKGQDKIAIGLLGSHTR